MSFVYSQEERLKTAAVRAATAAAAAATADAAADHDAAAPAHRTALVRNASARRARSVTVKMTQLLASLQNALKL